MCKVDTRAEIIQHSRDLFEVQGYSATTMRQIAERAGCTAGSLYYFFPEGKVEILRDVVRAYGLDPADRLSWVSETHSLDDLLDRLIVELPRYFQEVVESLVWLQLTPAQLEQSTFHMLQRFPLALYDTLYHNLTRFINDPQLCRQIAWSLYSLLYGYVNLYTKIGSVVADPLELDEIGACVKTTVAALIEQRKELGYVK